MHRTANQSLTATGSARIQTRTRRGLAMVALLGLLVSGAPAGADSTHNPRRGGHPLRFVAYVFHPVGYVLDMVLVRPLHWFARQDGVDEVVGHTNR